jgi:hypothetical protein
MVVDVAAHLRGDGKRNVRGREFAWAMDDIYFEGEWRGVQTRFARNTPDIIHGRISDRRNRREQANQNGQCQKATQENRHFVHVALLNAGFAVH